MSELLEKILSKDNMNAAYKRVCANKGAGGGDNVTVEELGDYMKENWESIREEIRRRKYPPTGQKGGNTQAKRRGAETWNPNHCGQSCTDGGKNVCRTCGRTNVL